MAITDWFELKDFQTLDGQHNVLNVYHFLADGALYSSSDIGQAYLDTLMGLITLIQSNQVVHDKLVVQNLGKPTDFVEIALAGATGGATGERTQSFTAFRLQFLRRRTDMRHGWKRYAGVTEVAVGGDTVAAGWLAGVQDIGDQLVNGLELATNPGTTVAQFGIIARICAEVDALGACVSWRLPANDAELKFYIPDAVIARGTVGSQVTRKN